MQRPIRWTISAATIATLIGGWAAGCTEQRDGYEGCNSDQQCQGERICNQARQCADPDMGADAGVGADTSVAADAGGDSRAQPDSDPPPEDCNAALAASATIAAPDSNIQDSDSPDSVEVLSLSQLTLDGRDSTADGDAIATYEWSVIEYPYDDQLPALKPHIDANPAGKASFVAKMVGTYVIELTVKDARGIPGCTRAQVSANIISDADIYVEMVWDTPQDADQRDDDGSDVDLHYAHPDGDWGFDPLDIFWDNETADWGEPGDAGDPVFLVADDDGAGPEAVEHLSAAPLNYRVGVYYYDTNGYGPSDVTLRVYLDGVLADEIDAERLPDTKAFYEALTIDAGSNSTQIDDVHYDAYPPAN